MAGIGADIKLVLSETGLKYDLYRDGALVYANQYVWLKSNAQVTKPFIREFFLEGQVAYDLDVRSGDLMVLSSGGTRRYLVAHSTPDSFENEVYRYSIVLYLANVLVSVIRPTASRSTSTYQATPRWTIVAQNLYVTLTSPLYGHELNDSEVGSVVTEVYEMYVPSSYGILPMDLVRIPSTGEFLQVQTVRKNRYAGLDVLELREDSFSATTTTSTTTTTTTTAP